MMPFLECSVLLLKTRNHTVTLLKVGPNMNLLSKTVEPIANNPSCDPSINSTLQSVNVNDALRCTLTANAA